MRTDQSLCSKSSMGNRHCSSPSYFNFTSVCNWIWCRNHTGFSHLHSQPHSGLVESFTRKALLLCSSLPSSLFLPDTCLSQTWSQCRGEMWAKYITPSQQWSAALRLSPFQTCNLCSPNCILTKRGKHRNKVFLFVYININHRYLSTIGKCEPAEHAPTVLLRVCAPCY